MSHPRIEEVEDSDIDMSDPSEGDIEDFVESDILRARSNPAEPFASKSFAIRRPPPSARAPGNGAAAAAHAAAAAKSHILTPSQIPMVSSGPPTTGHQHHHHQQQQQHTSSGIPTTADRKAYAAFQCLYPVYFDATRTRAEGRRVAKELAVANPLAREIVNACRDLRLQTVFEPDKMHPQDWANPGRVKVQLKGQAAKTGGAGGAAGVKNKHQLPAMTGGGVSENLFKDMMKEMQGGGDMAGLLGGAAGGGGGGGSGNASEDGGGKKGKKDKKGKGKA
ncbi:Signal recognition particle SEC65 subunit [Cytospora mali]|uniref:Signal recognition particle SEC65 subunit n=1 Tax=Cytospora mali TaxID=578113 RepID=A0A194V297_CYTMA|nr:Signal recognition particle SEC65 subunit [Valsa mali var. pyri (nom. inval.)]